MRRIYKRSGLWGLGLLMTSALAQADDQVIEAAVVQAETGIEVSVVYDAEAPLTGLGLMFHYDSSRLSFQEIKDVLQTGLMSTEITPQADAEDTDGDPKTDKVILVAWADLIGSQWPASMDEETVLYRVDFDAVPAADRGDTTIRFTASSTAAGHELKAEPVAIHLDQGDEE